MEMYFHYILLAFCVMSMSYQNVQSSCANLGHPFGYCCTEYDIYQQETGRVECRKEDGSIQYCFDFENGDYACFSK